MNFSDAITDALAQWFGGDLSTTVTYAGSAISAVDNIGAYPQRESDVRRRRATLIVKRSDVSAPAYRDKVVIGADTWYVLGVLKGDDYTWTLDIHLDERPVV